MNLLPSDHSAPLCEKCGTDHIVKLDDKGIRSVPTECFYCGSKVGERHSDECVILMRKVRVKMSIEIVREVPESWPADHIEWHMNESTSCAGNLWSEMEDYLDEQEGCLCGRLTGEYVGEEPAAPGKLQ